MVRKLAIGVMTAMALAGAALPALGDDWRAIKLRGAVLQFVDGAWQPLKRGDVVPDERMVRTMRNGRVTFQRGEETIDLGGDTQVQIIDRTGRKFTTVKQYFGTVGVEAEVQHVEHFSVQTPHLTAVVKGTRFVVRSDESGAEVDVDRGRVAVSDRDSGEHAMVAAGHSVSTTAEGGLDLDVSGEDGAPPLPKPGKHAGDEASRLAGDDKGGRGNEKRGPGGGGGHDHQREDKPEGGKRSEGSGDSPSSNSGGGSGQGSSGQGGGEAGSDESGRGEGSGRGKGGQGKG